MTPEEWEELIGSQEVPHYVQAHTYRRIRFGSFSSPVVLGCSDGEDYVVKAATRDQLRRAICNDQLIGRIANHIGSPVPPVALVDVPKSLLDNEPELAGIPEGLAHGSLYRPDASKTRQGFHFQDLPCNRKRFAMLAILYGLAHVDGDHQFFYEDGTNCVLSFDHGHFFPKGPDWTIQTLAAASPAIADQVIVSQCNLTPEELREGALCLSKLTSEDIAFAVRSPPESWGLQDEERAAVADHLDRRNESLRA